jgi:hypothetical protein
MDFIKSCPHCAKQMTKTELRAYSSRFGVSTAAPCPQCGTRLRWYLNDWWLAHAGALVILGGAFGLLATLAQWIATDSVAAFVGAMLAGAAITLFGVLRLRLERVDVPNDGE